MPQNINPITVGILILSDRTFKGEREDQTIPLLKELAAAQGWTVKETRILPDEIKLISAALIEMADIKQYQLILTSGGTGLSPRDNTPEATREIIEKEVPGLAEFMRFSCSRENLRAILSRGICGIRGNSLVINLPGSPRGALENLNAILPVLTHGLAKLGGDPSECASAHDTGYRKGGK
jgi:molybdenum cofactor synthesis domain-containing protein